MKIKLKIIKWISDFFLKLFKKKEPEFPSLLPIAMRVTAKTISNNLVSVKPLSAPEGKLVYIDNILDSKPIIPNVWKYQLEDCITIFDTELIGSIKPEFRDSADKLFKEFEEGEKVKTEKNRQDLIKKWQPIIDAQNNFKI